MRRRRGEPRVSRAELRAKRKEMALARRRRLQHDRKGDAWARRLVIPLLFVATGSVGFSAMYYRGSRITLPPVLAPADLQAVVSVDQTDRVGTQFRARLSDMPPTGGAPLSDAQIGELVGTLQAAGYDSFALQAPDGRTVLAGPLDDPRVIKTPTGSQGT